MEFTSEFSFSFQVSVAGPLVLVAGLALGLGLAKIAKRCKHGTTERRSAWHGGRRHQTRGRLATGIGQDALALDRPRRRRPHRRDVLQRVRGSSAVCPTHPRRGTVKAEQDRPRETRPHMDAVTSQLRHAGTPTNRLREWRHRRGWSLKELAERVGLAYGQVGKLERGDQDLSIVRLRQFAQVLGCSPADLLPPDLQSRGGKAV